MREEFMRKTFRPSWRVTIRTFTAELFLDLV